MYLMDTNTFLELLLNQERADEVEQLLRNISLDLLNLSEFSLYSIGIILLRQRRYDVFIQFVSDLLINSRIGLLRLSADDMERISETAQRFNLDFDDAYQYVVAEIYDLAIVSFDADFDRTERRRITPEEVLSTNGVGDSVSDDGNRA
jgi:uncharacterized protein